MGLDKRPVNNHTAPCGWWMSVNMTLSFRSNTVGTGKPGPLEAFRVRRYKESCNSL